MTRFKIDIVLDCADPVALAAFWKQALGYRDLWSTPDFVALVPPQGEMSPPLVLQRVPEPKSAKNRMHLDIICEDVEAGCARMVGFGAQRMHEGVQSLGDAQWITLQDPEGNEFCVCTGIEW